jgi:hypothetical protein
MLRITGPNLSLGDLSPEALESAGGRLTDVLFRDPNINPQNMNGTIGEMPSTAEVIRIPAQPTSKNAAAEIPADPTITDLVFNFFNQFYYGLGDPNILHREKNRGYGDADRAKAFENSEFDQSWI